MALKEHNIGSITVTAFSSFESGRKYKNYQYWQSRVLDSRRNYFTESVNRRTSEETRVTE